MEVGDNKGFMAYIYDAHIRHIDPILNQALQDLQRQITTIAGQTASNPEGETPPPPAITALSVTQANGVFDVQIQDNAPVNRGINYFLEYSTTSNFTQPNVVDLGASRSYRAGLGGNTFYFRAYSQYPTSGPSAPVYFGSALSPTSVAGGGSAGPTPQASTGSGTAPNTGIQGGAGFGYEPKRGPVLP